MNTSTDLGLQKVEAHEVRDDERIETLPRHFGRYMMRVEDAVYTFMRELAQEYRGGYAQLSIIESVEGSPSFCTGRVGATHQFQRSEMITTYGLLRGHATLNLS
jgi:hypothetical protein